MAYFPLPEELQAVLGDAVPVSDTVGLSSSSVFLYPDKVLKISPAGPSSGNEIRMLRWLQGKIPVPEVICSLRSDDMDYLLMERLAGRMSCSPDLTEDPEQLVLLLADAMRLWWSLDPTDCPSDQGLDRKLAVAEANVVSGAVDPALTDPRTFGPGVFSSPEDLLRWLKENRPPEDLTVTHGDFCLPNVFFSGTRLSGFLDLSLSGTADRWTDIALCWRSLRDNLHGRYASRHTLKEGEDLLFGALGIAPDEERMRYYLLLDELF